ncbi:kinesin-like protein Klp5 [Agyrium rufum]|nr:kinesin-like protein Klp5 [Agyrium rufum]
MDDKSSISVCVRVRPFTVREAAQLSHVPDGPLFLGDGSLAAAPTPKLSTKGLRSVIKVVDDKCLVFDPPEDNPVQRFSRSVVPNGKRVKDQTFGFDRIFDENVTQGDVYEATTRNLLDSVLDGYNATVFAYGATGCGKTHTITGTLQQPGIIFLTMQELFERIGERSEDKITEISLSYLEIYNETIRDLLVPGVNKGGLMLREDANQTVSVAGLSSHHPQNVQEVMDMIVRGNELRTMSPTEANATSSRSHAVLQINVSQKDRNADINEPHTMATLSIIDLAGSERASATKNRGERLLEGANINKSLLALGSCINALCDPRKKNHVPYRNSKLTRLLKFSLGGNCKTVMIVCVSPSSQHFDETQNTLRYANRAKNIQTKVTRNVFNVNRHVKDFLVKIDEQMAMINELKQQQKDHESIAFTKFRKQNEKRDSVVRESVARIRNAYDHSSKERLEKANNMRKLRQIERRISMIDSWVVAFDQVYDSIEDETILKSSLAMRKIAKGILTELETSRHHYRQRLNNSNWERAIDTALSHSLRSLKETEGGLDASDVSNLEREAELLKANADREALVSVAEQERASDLSTVQILLQAHFETVAAVEGLIGMSEEDAIEAAKTILAKILRSSTAATSHVIKPDSSIAPVELFPPTKAGTPKRKKQVILGGGTPLKAPKLAALVAADAIQAVASPARASPKRRKLGGAKKGIAFSPNKKRTPIKGLKRGVRWRDDTEAGTLAEFEKTPKRFDPPPEAAPLTSIPQLSPARVRSPADEDDTENLPVPPVLTSLPQVTTSNSSPIPDLPSANLSHTTSQPKSARFKTGFLAKKPSLTSSDGSPIPPTLSSRPHLESSSDTDYSPLRDLEPGKASNRGSLLHHHRNMSSQDSSAANSSGSANSSDTEVPDSSQMWDTGKSDAIRIRKAIHQSQRKSSFGGVHALGKRESLHGYRVSHRRRSPAGNMAGSPPSDTSGMFSASQARRMVRASEFKENYSGGILSPRLSGAAITKSGGASGNGHRRTTLGDGRSGAIPGMGGNVGKVSIGAGGGSVRGSMMPGKGVWR